MFSKLLTLVVALPLAILLVIFCVVNRQPITLSMDALGTMPYLQLEAPLFVLILGALILGLVLGGLFTWLGQGRHRARADHRERETAQLRREVDARDTRLRKMQGERDRERSAEASSRSPSPSAATLERDPSRPALAAPGSI